MDPITLATVTTAVATLGMDVAKNVATDAAQHVWGKIKGWLGMTKEPAVEDLAAEVATALAANTATLEKIVAELKAINTGTASRLVSKVPVTIINTTGPIVAGGKVTVVQGNDFTSKGDMTIGGG